MDGWTYAAMREGIVGDSSVSLPKFGVVRSYYEALWNGDLSSVFEVLHPQIVVHVPKSLPHGGDYSGHEGYKTLLEAIYRSYHLSFEVDTYFDVGEEEVVAFTKVLGLRFTGKAGGGIDMPALEYLKLENSKIVEIWIIYWDTATTLASLHN